MSAVTEIIRVLVLSYGSRAGKTSLIRRFTQSCFEEKYEETTTDIHSKQITVDGESVLIQILDTPGDPSLCDIAYESMQHADAFMVVYDASEAGALRSCISLRFSIVQEKQTMDPPIVLVGAKSDLKIRLARKLTAQEIAQNWECPWMEASAKLNVNVDEAFVELVRQFRSKRRVLVHENRSSSLLSNMFPRLRAWDSTETFGRALKSGWIQKRGYLATNWKLRYFTLYDDGSFQYFEDDGINSGDDTSVTAGSQTNPLGELNLKDVYQIAEHFEDGHDNVFVLQTSTRDWYFSCVNEMEKDAWLQVIVQWLGEFSSDYELRLEKAFDLDGVVMGTLSEMERDQFFPPWQEARLSSADRPPIVPQNSTASTRSCRETQNLRMGSIIEVEEEWD